MAANSTAAPDRAELEKVLDRRDPSEAYSALWLAQEEASAVALKVEAVVEMADGLKTHQEAADFLLGAGQPDSIGNAPESRELGPESLEKSNFRIDSTGWEIRQSRRDGTRFKINPEGDVTELLEGEFAGEQHFTWDAAMRETAKAGKRMPTSEEWGVIIRRSPDLIWQFPGGLAGYRYVSSAAFNNQGTNGNYWAVSTTGTYGDIVNLSSTLGVYPAGSSYRAYGFSVRCLKN